MEKKSGNIFKRVFVFIWSIIKSVFGKIGKVLKVVDDLIINTVAKLKIGKRIMLFTLVLICALVVFISLQSTNDFSSYAIENEGEMLQAELNRMHRAVRNKLRDFDAYIGNVSSRDEISDLILHANQLDEDGDDEYSYLAELVLSNNLSEGFFGFEIRNRNFNQITTIGEAVDTTYQNNPEVFELYERVAEMPVNMNFSFITLSDHRTDGETSYIELGAIHKISSSGMFGPSGAVLARERYPYDEFFNLVLPTPFTNIVQLYRGNEIYRTNYRLNIGTLINNLDQTYSNRTLSNLNLLNEDIIEMFKENNRQNTHIELMELESQTRERGEDGEDIYESSVDPYLVGYIALRNFHNQPIGYITVIQPLETMTQFLSEVRDGYIFNAVIFILISIIIVSIITRSITKPLKKVITATKEIAAGDLNTVVEIKTKDQIADVADTFNQMTAKLKNVVGEIVGASDNVYSMSQELSANTEEASAVSQEVAATSEEIATGTENQVEQTSKTKRILEVVEEQGGKVVVSSNKVSDAIEVASTKSNQGINVIRSLSETMLNIMKEVNNTGDEVKGLREQIEKINTIIDAIDYINEETSLLSLNAAIEAARAGEAGRGFAVVADEIRKLADESNDSVQEIHNIFKEINIAMQQVEKSMNNSSNMAKSSEEAVLNAEKSFEDILSSVQQVREISKEINHYVEEQKNSTKEISVAIDDVHRIAELNAEGADQSAKSSEEEALIIEQISDAAGELSNMANNLRSLVNIFKV
ncbi:methyl-accepting chemotaxis protein [Natronospora cellulosivora (SeqCode)]